MKQIITGCLAFFFIVGTANLAAQTKEETIEWINTNGRDFLFVNPDSDNYRIGQIMYEITSDSLKISTVFYMPKATEDYYNYLLFKSILYQDVNTIPIKEHEDDFRVKYFIVKTEPLKIRIKRTTDSGSNLRFPDSQEFRIYFYKENEENAKRTLKAIMHLAELSGAKENKQIF